jgi:hypothetical protein
MAESMLAETSTVGPFDPAKYYSEMRICGLEPCATFRGGEYAEVALIDVAAGTTEFFVKWALQGDPDRDLRRSHIQKAWEARDEGEDFVQLGV